MSDFVLYRPTTVPADDWEIERLTADEAATTALLDLFASIDATLKSGDITSLAVARSEFDRQIARPRRSDG